MTQTQLFKFTCSSTRSGIYLSAYASTIVYSPLPGDKEAYTRGNLIAIHFGGEPSIVQALCTLIASGMPLQVTTPEGSVELIQRKAKYQKTITGSNGYAEALLSLGPEEKTSAKRRKTPRGKAISSPVSKNGVFIFTLLSAMIPAFFNCLISTHTYRCFWIFKNMFWLKFAAAEHLLPLRFYPVRKPLMHGS